MSSGDSRSSASSGRQARHSKRRRTTADGDADDGTFNILLDYRLKNGLCHQCGTKLFKVEQDGELEPVHLPGIVLNGRCLFCYPSPDLPNDSPQGVPRAVNHAAHAQTVASMTNNANQVTARVQNNDEASRDPTNDQAPENVRKSSRTKRKDPRKSDVVSSSSNEPLTTSIRDADGVIFSGRVEQGTIHKGKGVFSHVHTEGEHAGKVSEYKGEFQDGMFHGTGTSKDASGCVYEGDFFRGAAHGIGKCHWRQQGWRYDGQWANDKRHGQGTSSQIEPGGEVYNGSWKEDQWDGVGTLKFAGGGEYSGDFKADKLHGKGTYTFADGSVYTGGFQRDMRHGHGEMTYTSERTRFVGAWSNNWRNGKGSLFYSDGSVWKGKWQGDEQEGVGYLHLPDGIVRKQRYVNGHIQGV